VKAMIETMGTQAKKKMTEMMIMPSQLRDCAGHHGRKIILRSVTPLRTVIGLIILSCVFGALLTHFLH